MIRLQPTGRKNKRTFRIVLQEKSQAVKAKAQEILGSYNPHLATREAQITLNTERVEYWLSQGAQASNTVHNMLVELGVVKEDKKRSVTGKKKGEDAEEAPAEEGGEAAESPEADAAEAPAEEAKEEAPAEEAAE